MGSASLERISIRALVAQPTEARRVFAQNRLASDLRVTAASNASTRMSSESQYRPEYLALEAKKFGFPEMALCPGPQSASRSGSQQTGANSKQRRSRKFWSPSEDAVLVGLIEAHGPCNWKALAENLPGRTADQLRTRWTCYLSKNVPQRSFDDSEDEFLLRAHAEFGNRWAHIARLMKDRSDNTVKNRFRVLMRRAAAKAERA
mmetsp:Transcript_5423/g.14564  ORF Transcript_5423/g.14564 Transcript_5423/m.14564 type:complete len:204 (+) Transcript_5423:184-795(+)|eukprot:CAMPEP_0185831808 /NCGR_PEP_ID=MMETSP1353-20130828/1711_1 /TAXON_ID=1077150 /ORGANISM="Erythrolobus australicus, Strain CCMP3124" /LENGTH=203 /DNA_ID=CAMNT_0028529917 /DNA_START=190 /DNA_END=801 /DNA_ORIENTATION=-